MIKYISNRTGGRLANQLFYVLQAFVATKRTDILHKYVPIETYAGKTDICKFQSQLNIEKYVSDSCIKIDIMQPFNNYYQILGKDYTVCELNEFIDETIIQSNCLKTIAGKIPNDHLAIHIRNGDYLKIPMYCNAFDRIQYLESAIRHVPEAMKTVDVFSDNNNLNKEKYDRILRDKFDKVNYIDGNDECIDLLMISAHKCKILWNSTFSLWSAYIGSRLFKDQHVICPSKFDANTSIKDRIFPDWVIVQP